jgi:hypothetical protein
MDVTDVMMLCEWNTAVVPNELYALSFFKKETITCLWLRD